MSTMMVGSISRRNTKPPGKDCAVTGAEYARIARAITIVFTKAVPTSCGRTGSGHPITVADRATPKGVVKSPQPGIGGFQPSERSNVAGTPRRAAHLMSTADSDHWQNLKASEIVL